jgi:predicted CopG family antitoxin
MLMKIKIVIILVTVISLTSCKQNKGEKSVIDLDSIDLSDAGKHLSELDTVGSGIPIFYNMYLSVELSSLFETAGAVFAPELLNRSDKTTEYITSYKKAMNLGVYAVDLSYARAFEQFEVSGKYFNAMQVLSEQLGIPQNYFEETAQRFERNITNRDSLITIANEVYYETEDYLKENERFATASVIIMGGWIEAIYIATNVVTESRNPDVIERLLDQKYSLNNLLIMLKDYSDNEVVSEYTEKLQKLRKLFDTVVIDIPAGFEEKTKEDKVLVDQWLMGIKKIKDNITILRAEVTQ